jgi:hypothetical protein
MVKREVMGKREVMAPGRGLGASMGMLVRMGTPVEAAASTLSHPRALYTHLFCIQHKEDTHGLCLHKIHTRSLNRQENSVPRNPTQRSTAVEPTRAAVDFLPHRNSLRYDSLLRDLKRVATL